MRRAQMDWRPWRRQARPTLCVCAHLPGQRIYHAADAAASRLLGGPDGEGAGISLPP